MEEVGLFSKQSVLLTKGLSLAQLPSERLSNLEKSQPGIKEQAQGLTRITKSSGILGWLTLVSLYLFRPEDKKQQMLLETRLANVHSRSRSLAQPSGPQTLISDERTNASLQLAPAASSFPLIPSAPLRSSAWSEPWPGYCPPPQLRTGPAS